MLVSIGLPTFNRPASLKKALDCLVEQSYKNIEIILSDNASTDLEVGKVIQQFLHDPRIKYFRQDKNIGALKNYLFVTEKSTGEFFFRMGDDDCISSNYIESCVNFLITNRDYAGAYGHTEIVDSNGVLLDYDPNISFEENDPRERIVNYYRTVTTNGVYFSVLRKEMLRFVKTPHLLAHDWLIVARVLAKGKVKMLPGAKFYLTTGGVSKSLQNIISTFNLSDFNSRFPLQSILLNAAKDILFRSAAFSGFSAIKKWRLVREISKTLSDKFNLDKRMRKHFKEWFFWKIGSRK